jgi:CRISPR system Cascade subunit CasB
MKDNAHEIAATWWRGLQPGAERGGDRGALARLRRAPSITALMGLPETIGLFRRLGGATPNDLPRVALVAGVLSHLREEPSGREGCARLLGPDNPEKPETALMSPLRFRRLTEAETEEERLVAFRRMVALARGALPARDLAAALLFWGPSLRQSWIYDYWGAGQPAPLMPNGQDTP